MPGAARSSGGDGRTSLLFWLMMLALGCMAWASVAWAASNLLAKKGQEKLLQVGLLLPKLNMNHTSEPHPSELAHPKDRPTLAVGHSQVKFVETPAHVDPPRQMNEAWWNPVANVTPPPIVEACDEPVVYVQPCTLQPGDTPMMRTWKTVTMYSLLAGAVTLAPPPLLADGDKGIQSKSDALEKLQKSVDAIAKRLDDLEKKPGVDNDALVEIFRLSSRNSTMETGRYRQKCKMPNRTRQLKPNR